MARQTRPLSPAEAVRQGRKLIAERRKAAARARLLPWSPPAFVETTVVRVSPPAPARWPRVWVRPQVALRYEVLGFVPSEPRAVAQQEPLPAGGRGGRSDLVEIRQRLDSAHALADGAAAAAQRLRGAVETAGLGGAKAGTGKPVSEQDQRVRVVPNCPEIPGSSPAAAAPSVAPRVISDPVEPTLTPAADLRNRPRDMHAAMSVFMTSEEVARTDTHIDGTWPLADLRSGQCRFACTADDAPRDQHRFCGGPVAWLRGKPTSWCADHLPRVMGAPGRSAGGMSVAQAQAAAMQQEPA